MPHDAEKKYWMVCFCDCKSEKPMPQNGVWICASKFAAEELMRRKLEKSEHYSSCMSYRQLTGDQAQKLIDQMRART